MPKFKTDIDLQLNQLLSAVMHNLPTQPSTPVEGQMYFDSAKKSAMIWNGTKWAVWGDASAVTQIKQFTCNHTGPILRTGSLIVRLYQNLTVLRIDSHINGGTQVDFNVEHRSAVNTTGTALTTTTIPALPGGTETTSFGLSNLSADNWLYLDITNVTGTVNRLTITITCAVT